MTILEELKEYANNCLNDADISEYEKYISCVKHKWACLRLLKDIEKMETQEDYPFYWDEEEANSIVKWFTYLRHSIGELAGEPINLHVWQKFFICQIYGWKRKEDNRRRFKKSFIECARKQAKSQMESGITLYEMAKGSTKNGEVYECCCAGVKRQQSLVVFEECKRMLKGSPLAQYFKINKGMIIHIKTGSYLRPLSKDDGKKNDGGNMAIFVLDEYHQHPTNEFYAMALYGQNSKEPLLMIITTAGVDLNSPCFTQEYKYCGKILDPADETENDEYFCDIVELDEGDDISDIRNWWKANPLRMSYKQGQQKLMGDYKEAVAMPDKMPDFMTKCLDIWVQCKENGYMNMKSFEKCQVDNIPYDLKGRPVYVGVDLASKIDLCSIAFIFPIDDTGVRQYVVKAHSFIANQELLKQKELIDKKPYLSWLQQGYLSLTGGKIVNQFFVYDYIMEQIKENGWDLQLIALDPDNSAGFGAICEKNFTKYLEVYQSKKHLNEPTKVFREQVYEGNVMYEENPLMSWCMGNAVIESKDGLIKIDKSEQKNRIDTVDAIMCAMKFAPYHEKAYNALEALEAINWD